MAKRRRKRKHGAGRVAELPSGKFNAIASGGKDPVTGKRVRPQATFDTRAEAEAWLAQRAEIGGSDWTVGRWLDHWLDTVRLNNQPATLKSYKKHVEQHIRPHLGTLPVRKLDRVAVDRWRANLAGLPGSAGQKQRAAKTLGTAMRAALDAGVVPRNPVGKVRLVRGGGRTFDVWTADQCLAFLAYVENATSARVWRLLLDTGMRPGELLALTWGDFDWGRGAVRIDKAVAKAEDGSPVVKPPKTEQGIRTVVLHPSTVAALKPLAKGPGDLFWPKRRNVGRRKASTPVGHSSVNTLYDEYWRRLIKSAVRDGVVPRIRMYDLRHTSASLLLAAGVSLRVVADRLGHDPAITLKHYARFLPGQQEAAREALGGFLQAREPGTI